MNNNYSPFMWLYGTVAYIINIAMILCCLQKVIALDATDFGMARAINRNNRSFANCPRIVVLIVV